MHLLCQDTECPGNDLPAGGPEAETCCYCQAPLADADGNVLAVGAAPLVRGEPARSFDALMDALRDAGAEVTVVNLTAVRQGDQTLLSATTDEGELKGAAVVDTEHADNLMALMEESA